MTTQAQRITKARANLVLDQPFFGALALRLQIEERSGLGGCAVDGKHFFYDPGAVEELQIDEIKTTIAEGVMHCALGHPFRRGARDKRIWNDAGDHVVRLALRDAGMAIPKDWPIDPRFAGRATEQVYARLYEEALQNDQCQGGEGKDGEEGEEGEGRNNSPQHTGGAGVMDPPPTDSSERRPSEQELRDMEQDWQEAMEQAAFAAQQMGNAPGSAIERIRDARQPKAPWQELLRNWLTQMAQTDYTWSRPDRRFLAQHLILPDLQSDGCPPLVVAFDTSASVSPKILADFCAELNQLLGELRPERVYLMHVDASVQHVEELTADDLPFELEAKGRGGTWFDPAFEWVAEHEDEIGRIGGLIYFTDMYAEKVRVENEPDYPVLWCDYGESIFQNMGGFYSQRFGERVYLLDAPEVAPGYEIQESN